MQKYRTIFVISHYEQLDVKLLSSWIYSKQVFCVCDSSPLRSNLLTEGTLRDANYTL